MRFSQLRRSGMWPIRVTHRGNVSLRWSSCVGVLGIYKHSAPPELNPSSGCKKAINLFVDGLCKSSNYQQQAIR